MGLETLNHTYAIWDDSVYDLFRIILVKFEGKTVYMLFALFSSFKCGTMFGVGRLLLFQCQICCFKMPD